MACDMFSSAKALELLRGKTIYFFGDSNVRALYKDLLWLLEDGRLIPNASLRMKNEKSFANDIRLTNGMLHSGRNYEEARLYSENPYLGFRFITRLQQPAFIDTIKNMSVKPDVLVINSCVWDLTRWGSNGVDKFKNNVKETFSFLKSHLPSTRIIWLTTLPPSFKSQGGFLTKEIEFLRNMLPWHILFANKYASDVARSLEVDVLDLHYYFRLLLNYHTKDGIHWTSKAVRHATNMLLTHIALSWNCKLPGEVQLDKTFLECFQENESKRESKSTTVSESKPKIFKHCNTAGSGSSKRWRDRNLKDNSNFNNFQSYSSTGASFNEQNRGNLQIPFDSIWNSSAFDIWHRDYSVDNFASSVFTTPTQNEQNFFFSSDGWRASGFQQTFANIRDECNSRGGTFNFFFDGRQDMHNSGRVNKRSRNRQIAAANRKKLKYMYRNERDM